MATNHEPDAVVRIVLIDDDEEDYLLTRDLLAEASRTRYRLDWAPTYEQGLEAVTGGNYDVCLLDYQLGPRTGLDLLGEVCGGGCPVATIFLTGQSMWEIDFAAMELGATDFLDKAGLNATLLERSIRYALQQRRYEVELEHKVRERTEELARANAALREADRRKDEFLATLAHELRNPLAPIRNALEIMRMSPGRPEAAEQARAIVERQIAQMVRLVNDLLDVSRITRGKLSLKTEPFDLAEAVAVAVETSRPHLDEAGIALELDLATEPLAVEGDRLRLAQVFTNLLNNAAKYSERGGQVCLTTRRDAGQVLTTVADNGLGLPSDVLPKVFDLFTQVDRNLNRAQGGLGIGLALVKQITTLHGGTVYVTSEGPGMGSTFAVRLPSAGVAVQ